MGEISYEFWDLYKALKKTTEVDFESDNKIVSMFAKKSYQPYCIGVHVGDCVMTV